MHTYSVERRRQAGQGGPEMTVYWGLLMKSTFYDSPNILLDKKSAGTATDLLSHPLDLGEGRRVRSTTVLCVRRGDSVVMAADGQVTLGANVMKHSAKKIRRLYQDKVLAGFAGSTADAF